MESVEELRETLAALLDCAATSSGLKRFRFLAEALKLHTRIRNAEARYPLIEGEPRSFGDHD